MKNENSLKNLKPFKKGIDERRSPGKPKGTLSAKTIIRKWLEAQGKGKNITTGKSENMTQLDIITLKQLEKAIKGDTYAFNALLDRTEGKPKQDTSIDLFSNVIKVTRK